MTSTLYVEELKGRTSGSNANKVIVPTGQKIVGTDTGSVYSPGMILQMVGDTYAPNTYLDVTTSDTRPLGTNLEVSLTTQSTDNKLFIQIFVPDLYNHATATRALMGGFRYSTDSFSSSDVQLGEKETIMDHEGYNSSTDADLAGFTYCTWCSVPVAGAIKIQPRLQAYNGTMRIMANNTSTFGVCTLIVQEIKG